MTGQIFTPRAWQRPMIDHILDVPRGALFAGMGLGKTTATMTALDYMFLTGDVSGPVLVVAPLRVATSTWPDEAKKWGHLRHIEVQPITGSREQRAAALKNTNASIFTINYENLVWLAEHLAWEKRRWPFAMVVCDESTKLKGFRTRQGGARAKALAKVMHTEKSGHKLVERVSLLTGTPSPNGLKDLWGQLWYLDAGERLGRSYTAFMDRWFRKSFDGFSYDPQPYAQAQIEAAIADLCLGLDIRDFIDIKEPIVNTIYVDLPRKAHALYDQMEKEMFIQVQQHDVEAFGAAAKTMKCLQLANGAVYVGESNSQWEEVHDAKIQAIDSVVEEAAGTPVLVAYHFKSDLARLQRAFPSGKALTADPGIIRDWNAGKVPVLFAHPASAGHGLNLQDGGNILVFFGHNWNLEEYLQIIERIGPTRQFQAGHDRPVFIHHIVARDTVDEIVMARRDSKKSVQDLLLEACKRKGM